MSFSVQTAIPWSTYRRLSSQPPPVPLQAYRPCPMTGDNGETIELFRMDDFQFYEDRQGQNRILHRLVMNLHSGLIYTNPCYTPEGFSFLFQNAGSSYGNPNIGAHREFRLQWLLDHLPPQTAGILDVGCGSGGFLKSLPAHWRKVGVDIDAPSIAAARQQDEAIEFHCADLSSFQIDGPFHLISLIQVLEHLDNPLATLRNLRRMARSDTLLYVEVPDLQLFAENHDYCDLVGMPTVMHVTQFSRSTLEALLCLAGWRPVKREVMALHYSYGVLAAPDEEQHSLPDEAIKQRDLQLAQQYFTRWHSNTQRIQAILDLIPAGRDVMIWGAGLHTEYLNHWTHLFTTNRRFIVIDKDPLKQGTTYHGIPVLHSDAIPDMSWQNPDFQLVVSTYTGQPQIAKWLMDKGFPSSHLTLLYPTA